MGEDLIITQMGLIFTQMKLSRRLLEDIERETSRYSALSLGGALSSSASKFGEPPMYSGALRVYVININDLTSGGPGGLIETIFGAVGRFAGGTIGGLFGGIVGGAALPYNLAQLARIAEAVDRIIDRLGIGQATSGTSATSSSLPTLLPMITNAIQALKNMFQSAATPGTGPGSSPGSLGGQQWLAILQAVKGIVDGLILLIPVLIGALASLLYRLDDIKRAILDVLQFALRNVLLLRGVALATIYETMASVARLGATVVATMTTGILTILNSVFHIIDAVLSTAQEAIQFISRGLKATIDPLMDWLRNGLGNILIMIGNLRVFRLLFHLVDILPAILPPLLKLLDKPPLTTAESGALSAAAARPVPGPGAIGGAGGPIAAFPDLAAAIAPPAGAAALRASMSSTATVLNTEIGNIARASQGTLRGIAGNMEDALTHGEDRFNQALDSKIGVMQGHAGDLTKALVSARDAAVSTPDKGLDAIAKAYQDWIQNRGLDTLLERITIYFGKTPVAGAGAARSLPGQIVSEAPGAVPRATVEIQDVVIDVQPEAGVQAAAAAGPLSLEDIRYQQFAWQERGGWSLSIAPVTPG